MEIADLTGRFIGEGVNYITGNALMHAQNEAKNAGDLSNGNAKKNPFDNLDPRTWGLSW